MQPISSVLPTESGERLPPDPDQIEKIMGDAAKDRATNKP
jgi:hypothetical protein